MEIVPQHSLAMRVGAARSTSDSALQFQRETLSQNGIVLTQMVGFGGQGKVFRGFRQGNPMLGTVTVPVAVKVIRKYAVDMSINDQQRARKHVEREIQILKAVQHQKCLEFYDCIEDDEAWYIVTEYLSGMDLFEQATQRVFYEDEILMIAYQVLQALDHLHSVGIAHRDVKLENIMFTRAPKSNSTTSVMDVKLIDFGFAYYEKFDQMEFQAVDTPGTAKYKSPELAKKTAYDPRTVDLWAVGVFMYVLITGDYPFNGRSDEETLGEVIKTKELYSQSAWKSISKETRELVQALLNKNAAKRLKASEAMAKIEKILMSENEIVAAQANIKAAPVSMAQTPKSFNVVSKIAQVLRI